MRNREIKKKRIYSDPKQDITKEILLGILKTGAVLAVAFIAPGALKVFNNFGKTDKWDKYYPSSISKVTKRLYRKGLVEIKHYENRSVVKITKKGKIEVLKYDLDNMRIKPPDKWDGKWRLVIFDISEKYRKTRDLVRDKLKEIGFYQFQESVFIYPYPCEKEMKYLREVLHVPHEIKLLRADRVENDEELRKIFKLENI